MKKLNFELFVIAIVCILIGLSTIFLAIKSFFVISQRPTLPVTREVVSTLQQIDFIQECGVIPLLGIAFLVIGAFIVSHIKRRKSIEIYTSTKAPVVPMKE